MNDVVLPPIRGIDKGDFLLVSFERGSKTTDSKEVKISDISSTGDMTIEFDENLVLDATLYRESSGTYQVFIFCIYLFIY